MGNYIWFYLMILWFILKTSWKFIIWRCREIYSYLLDSKTSPILFVFADSEDVLEIIYTSPIRRRLGFILCEKRWGIIVIEKKFLSDNSWEKFQFRRNQELKVDFCVLFSTISEDWGLWSAWWKFVSAHKFFRKFLVHHVEICV